MLIFSISCLEKIDHVTTNGTVGLPLRLKFMCFPRSSEFYRSLFLTFKFGVYKKSEMG